MKLIVNINDKIYRVYTVNEIPQIHFKGDIEYCYTRPSEIKKAIYRECITRTYEIEKHFGVMCHNYGVVSYNCMMFTYGAIFKKNGENVMYYHETKTRRELYIKKGVEI